VTSFGRVLKVLVVALALILPRGASAADPPHARRFAVIVGSNEPAPGRMALRYAQADAQLMADVLVRVGRFAKADVQVLLEPRPTAVLAALDSAAREVQVAGPDSLLLFYYSGHSDGLHVFPHGDSLALADLRDRLAKSTARVRIAILDTCRGGGWTRAKGLTVGPPLDAADLMNVATEGTALLSSSSGLENAHEAGSVRGSFFTHHVAAGLLGAADRSGDGNVTLQEVFEYAKERTVRDSARMAATPQHPSFDMQLRGRQDIVLAQLASSSSALEVSQTKALEIIHLASGTTVLETPAGPQQLRLALVPGRYVVRRVVDGRVYSKEVEVRAGETVTLSDVQLELTGSERLSLKDDGDHQPYSDHSTPLRNWWELRLGLGVSSGRGGFFGSPLYLGARESANAPLERSFAAVGAITYGITSRLSVAAPVPAFAYRLGNEGSFEVIPRAGLTDLGYTTWVGGGLYATVDGGLAVRSWLTRDLSFVSNASASSTIGHSEPDSWYFSKEGGVVRLRYRVLDAQASAGLVWNIENRVTLALGVGWSGRIRLARTDSEPAVDDALPQPLTSSAVVVGAVQAIGYRPLPLLQVHLSRRFSVDGYASWSIDLRNGEVRDRYLGGFTWGF